MIGRGGLGATCSPSTDANCPFTCYWSTAPNCDINPAIRAAAGGWLCSVPGSSYLSSCAAPTPPAPAPPAGPSTSQQETVLGAWTPDQAIQATAAAQQQQNLDFFGQLATQNPPAAAPDCTSAWTALTNTACWSGVSSSLSSLLPILLIGGGFLIVAMIRR